MDHSDQTPLIMPSTHQTLRPNSETHNQHTETDIKHREESHRLQNYSEVKQTAKEIVSSQKQSGKISQVKAQSSKRKKSDDKDMQKNVKLAEIIKRKKELEHEIVRLKYNEENQQKIKHKGFDRNTRSQITQEEKQRIRKALEDQKRFEETTNAKNIQLEQKIRQKELSKEKQYLDRIESIRSLKRKEALQHLEMIRAQQLQRTKAIKEANKKFEETKLKSFLHQKMEQKWRTDIADKQQTNKKVLETIKQKNKFSRELLKRHEQEYKKILESDTIQRLKNKSREIQEKKLVQIETLNRYKPSRFLKTIFQQEEQLRNMQRSKSSQLFSNINRKTIFAETVRQNNKEAIIKRQTLSPIQQKKDSRTNLQNHKGRSLSQMDVWKLGNNYMREIHSSLSDPEAQKKREKREEITLLKYNDYLKEQREKRAQIEKNSEVIELRQLKSLIKKQMPVNEKWRKAKLLTSRLQQRDDLSTDMLLKSISTKITLISEMRGE